MKFTRKPLRFLTAAAVLGLSLVPRHMEAASAPIAFSHDIDLKFGWVGGASTHGGGTEFGSVDELKSSGRYVLSSQVSRRVLMHFGVEWQRFSFGRPESVPIPDSLQQIDALLGLDWQFNDQWLFRADLRPGIYSDFQDIGWNDVGAPFVLSAAYLANADLQWVFGLLIDPRSNYPVIPAVGARWKFADQWTLRALVPEPRLEYEISEKMIAYLGGEFDLGTYRLSDRFGDVRSYAALNGAIVDYMEARVGPGFSWRIRPEIEIGASGGCMVYRRFYFGGRHPLLSSEPAPYFQINCQLRF